MCLIETSGWLRAFFTRLLIRWKMQRKCPSVISILFYLQPLSDLIAYISLSILFVANNICSVSNKELHFDNMRINVCLTPSQKAIRCALGVSIAIYSRRAIESFNSRESLPGSSYTNFKNWLPTIQNHEAKKPSTFAILPPRLIYTLHTTLT